MGAGKRVQTVSETRCRPHRPVHAAVSRPGPAAFRHVGLVCLAARPHGRHAVRLAPNRHLACCRPIVLSVAPACAVAETRQTAQTLKGCHTARKLPESRDGLGRMPIDKGWAARYPFGCHRCLICQVAFPVIPRIKIRIGQGWPTPSRFFIHYIVN